MVQESYPVAVKSSCKHITDQQRARITENFKAAKALLARKRPPEPFTSPIRHEIPHKKSSAKDISETTPSCFLGVPDSRNTNVAKVFVSSDVIGRPRFPLAEIQANMITTRNMDTVKFCGSSDLSEPPRIPLAEIQTNMMTSRYLYKCNTVNIPNAEFRSLSKQNQNSVAISSISHMDSEYSTSSSLKMEKKQEENKIFVPPDNKSEFPEKQNKTWMQGSISNGFCFSSEACLEASTSENCIPMPAIPSENFDDALFEEIDALCMKKTMLREEDVSIRPVNMLGGNHGKVPSVSCNAAFADMLSLVKHKADHEGNFLGTEICPAEKFHGSSLQCDTRASLKSAEISSSCSMSFMPSDMENLVSTRVKTDMEDTHQSQPKLLEVVMGTSIQSIHNTNFSDANQVDINSMIISGEANHQLLPEHSLNPSNCLPDYSCSSDASSISASDTLPTYLQSLNETQREAATSDISKPLLILAGPGSGKTSTMVARLLTLLKEGVHPRNILAMTFTTAAATEMGERVGAVVGKTIAKELSISTFHSFCLQLCRLHAEKLGRTSEFLIYGHGHQRRAIIEAVRLMTIEDQVNQCGDGVKPRAGIDADKIVGPMKDKSKKWQQFVTQAKAAGRTPEDYEKMGNKTGASILGHYNATLKACNALDYHDFISCAVKLLRDHSEVFEECQKTWTAILVDEFQDTSGMQYCLLKLLSSHNRITVVGDDDQSIFSFNGADISGFDSFRKDFPSHKEVRLHQNYRSTRCIVEAASSLIRNNVKRCPSKRVFTDNVSGDKIIIRECRNEDAQCAFVVDNILMATSVNSKGERSFANIAILYRRQVSGKLFQSILRARKIPFNVHGVAFYRKKVIKAVISMLQTSLSMGGDGPCRCVFKALYPGDKEEKKRAIDYVEKVANSTKCGFLMAAREIFTSKVSGTFNRRQLAQGRRVLFIIDTIYKLVRKERSLSAIVTSAVNFIPQKFLFEKRAIIDEDSGKFLNEEDDPRSVLEYLLDDVSDFLCNHLNSMGTDEKATNTDDQGGCMTVLKVFLDYLSTREMENFRCRREHNRNSVTLTTMHQSKGLEWDTVFIVKTNDSEIPLLHESMGSVKTGGSSLEEERRLFYVAMTRARKNLYISYVVMDSNWQLLQPSRFLKELPCHLIDIQGESSSSRIILEACQDKENMDRQEAKVPKDHEGEIEASESREVVHNQILSDIPKEKELDSVVLNGELSTGSPFLKGFSIEARPIVAALFHMWAKKRAFHEPKRLLDKVGFVIDERIRNKTCKNKDALRALKCCLKDDEALLYAEQVIKWEQMPPDEKALIQAERQEHFQRQGAERAMVSTAATAKQISYLQSLGCTITPTSRLHASRLIEQYKSL